MTSSKHGIAHGGADPLLELVADQPQAERGADGLLTLGAGALVWALVRRRRPLP